MSTPARRSPSALLSGFASRFTLSLNPWSIALFLIALIVALPILVVLGHIVMPTEAFGSTQHGSASLLIQHLLAGTVGGVRHTGNWHRDRLAGGDVSLPGKRLFEWALLLPLAVPTYVIAYAYTDFLQVAGPLQSLLREWFHWQVGDYYFPNVRSLGAATLITFVLYPYVYLLARASFLEQSVCVLDVGRTLGRGPWRLFASVALPLARPALVGGVSLVLMETLNEFGAVQFFGVDTFTTGIYRTWFGLGEPIAAAQLAASSHFCDCFWLLERWSRGKRRYFHTTNRYQQLPEYRLHGWHAVGATLACLLPITVGFLLPSGILLEMAITTGDSLFGTRFIGFAMNSLSLATVAALIAVGLAVLLSYGVRLHNSPVRDCLPALRRWVTPFLARWWPWVF